jgi:hypothetical protein
MKNKALAMILTLVSSTILISCLAALGAGPFLIILVGLVPALSYSIYFGIKEYKCFFLNDRSSQPRVPDHYRVPELGLDIATFPREVQINIHKLNERLYLLHESEEYKEVFDLLNETAEKILLEIEYPPTIKQIMNLKEFQSEDKEALPLKVCYSLAY